jgi:hypothetical protein
MTGLMVQQHKVMQAQTIFSWIFQSYLCARKQKAGGFHSVIFASLRRVVYYINFTASLYVSSYSEFF